MNNNSINVKFEMMIYDNVIYFMVHLLINKDYVKIVLFPIITPTDLYAYPIFINKIQVHMRHWVLKI